MLVTIAGVPTGLHTDLLPSLRRSLEVGWPREETKITLLPCSKTHPLVIRVSDKPKKASVNAIRLYVAEVCATHSSAHGWWFKGFHFTLTGL